MSSVRPAPGALKDVLGNAPRISAPDGAQPPLLRRIQKRFASARKWNRNECADAFVLFLGLEAFNNELLPLVEVTYRAWQLVRFCSFKPDEALRLVSAVGNYCPASGYDYVKGKVPSCPPPGYDGCQDCWKSRTDAQKRLDWDRDRLPFLIATGQVEITESGGGGGGATDDDPAAGAEPGNGP